MSEVRRKARPEWAKLEGFPARLRWAIDRHETYSSAWSVGVQLKTLGLISNETYLFKYLTDADGNLKDDVGARPTDKVMDMLWLLLDTDRKWLDKGVGEPFTDQRERQVEMSKIEAEVASKKKFSRGQRLDLIRQKMEADGIKLFHHRLITAMDDHGEFNTGQRIINALKELDIKGAASTNFYLYGDFVPKRTYIEAASSLLDVNPDWLETGQGKMHINGKPTSKVEIPKPDIPFTSRKATVTDPLPETSPLAKPTVKRKSKPKPEAPKAHPRLTADEAWLARVDSDLGALTTRVDGMEKKIDAILEWAEMLVKAQRGPVI